VEGRAASGSVAMACAKAFVFIDEVIAFNSASRTPAALWVWFLENGTVHPDRATTEPCFEVNKALVRSLAPVPAASPGADELGQLLERALAESEAGYGDRPVALEPAAAAHLLDVAVGDAAACSMPWSWRFERHRTRRRRADPHRSEHPPRSRSSSAALSLRQAGDAHFDTISAFIKVAEGLRQRRGPVWLARMVRPVRIHASFSPDVDRNRRRRAWPIPRRRGWSSCAGRSRAGGAAGGALPLAQAALLSRCAEKSKSRAAFSSQPNCSCRPASRPFPPPADAIAMARPS